MGRLMKLNKWQAIIVEWEDASGTYEGRNSSEFASSYVPYIRRSIGFFLNYSDSGIFLCDTDDRKIPSHEDCENITVIPKGMIRRVLELSDLQSALGTPQPETPSKPLRKSRR